MRWAPYNIIDSVDGRQSNHRNNQQQHTRQHDHDQQPGCGMLPATELSCVIRAAGIRPTTIRREFLIGDESLLYPDYKRRDHVTQQRPIEYYKQPAAGAAAAQCWFLYFSDWKKNRLGPSEKSQHIFQVSSLIFQRSFYFYFYFSVPSLPFGACAVWTGR